MSNINIENTKYNKEAFKKVVDINFDELISSDSPVTSSSLTVEDFFEAYNTLFYDIPIEGEFNSHKYILERSTDYVGVEQNNSEIDLLLEEINQLNLQLLESKQIIDTLTE